MYFQNHDCLLLHLVGFICVKLPTAFRDVANPVLSTGAGTFHVCFSLHYDIMMWVSLNAFIDAMRFKDGDQIAQARASDGWMVVLGWRVQIFKVHYSYKAICYTLKII